MSSIPCCQSRRPMTPAPQLAPLAPIALPVPRFTVSVASRAVRSRADRPDLDMELQRDVVGEEKRAGWLQAMSAIYRGTIASRDNHARMLAALLHEAMRHSADTAPNHVHGEAYRRRLRVAATTLKTEMVENRSNSDEYVRVLAAFSRAKLFWPSVAFPDTVEGGSQPVV